MKEQQEKEEVSWETKKKKEVKDLEYKKRNYGTKTHTKRKKK